MCKLNSILSGSVADITHTYSHGNRVLGYEIALARRPIISPRTIAFRVPEFADFYGGPEEDQEGRLSFFFAPECLQNHQAVAAFRLFHWASLEPERFHGRRF